MRTTFLTKLLACVGLAMASVSAQAVTIQAGQTVLAFGDSLTLGYGVDEDESYPAWLKRLLPNVNVVNAGINGETSAEGLARLEKTLAQHKPRLVLLGLGGNDLLRKLSEEELESNLNRMIERIRAFGAQVVLLPVPSADSTPSNWYDHPVFERVVTKQQIPWVPKMWGYILQNPEWTRDPAHPNAIGYQAAAQILARAIEVQP